MTSTNAGGRNQSDFQDCGRLGRQWSLWDMLRAYASEFMVLKEVLDALEQFQPTPGQNALMQLSGLDTAEFDARIRAYWPGLKMITQRIPLPSVVDGMARIQRRLDGSHTQQEIITLMTELKNRLEDDLRRQLFFHVKAEHVAYYNEPHLFGADVAKVFPTTRDDIESAGKCLALGQGTASVFHLMGVIEISLRALGKSLGIDYAPSWESYIRQITRKMGEDHKKKSEQWKRHEQYYRDLLGDLTAVKNAWRNPTIHVKRKYSTEEAEEIFIATRTFMKRASKKLCDGVAEFSDQTDPEDQTSTEQSS